MLFSLEENDDLIVKAVVRKSPGMGRGVFAVRDIKEGELIHRAPVLVITDKLDIDRIMRTKLLSHYVVRYGGTYKRPYLAIMMGIGSFFNHAVHSNARYDEEEGPNMIFTAVRDIKTGEEIFINYNGAEDEDAPWFFD